MKKMILLTVVIFSVVITSCSGKKVSDDLNTQDSIPAVINEEIPPVIPTSVSSDTAIIDEIGAETAQ